MRQDVRNWDGWDEWEQELTSFLSMLASRSDDIGQRADGLGQFLPELRVAFARRRNADKARQKLIEAAIRRATGEHRVLNAYDYEDVFACCEAVLAAAPGVSVRSEQTFPAHPPMDPTPDTEGKE